MDIDNSFRDDSKPFRRFYLKRIKDETGISRTGRVLEGVLTQSGKAITEWRPPHSTIGVYNTFQEFMLIHVDCHPSCNEVVWIDHLRECLDHSFEEGKAKGVTMGHCVCNKILGLVKE